MFVSPFQPPFVQLFNPGAVGGVITYSISGTVSDGVNGVAGVTVALGTYSTTTAAGGTYTITGIAAGANGSLTATKTGYVFASITISAMSGDLTGQNFTSPWYLYDGILSSNCIAAYQPKGAATYANSKINLANPGTYDCTDGTAYPTWDAINGWKFLASSSQYLTGGPTPANTQIWSVFIKYTTLTYTNYGTFCGYNVYEASPGFGVQQDGLGGKAWYDNGNQKKGTTLVPTSTGIIGVAGTSGYINTSADVTSIGTHAGSMGAMYFGADYRGSYTFFLTAYIQAIGIYNIVLSSAQISALETAMNAL